MNASTFQVEDQPKRKSLWIPWCFVGFFLVVVTVNGIMLSFALSSFNGLSTDGAFDRGLAYNEILAEREAQEALGWQLAAVAEPLGEGVIDVRLQALDDTGLPVTDAQVVAQLTRPINDGHDFSAELSHRGDGVYGALVPVPLDGRWNLRMDITRGTDHLRADTSAYLAP